MARFLGGSNILRGKALDASRVAFAGTAVDCSGGPLVPGADVAMSIRQHDIAISADQPATGAGSAVEGTVVRNVFLGATRDYVVEARDGTQLRITAPPHVDLAPGQRGVADAAGRSLPRAGGVTHHPKSGHFHPAATLRQCRPSTNRSTSTFATTRAPPSSIT